MKKIKYILASLIFTGMFIFIFSNYVDSKVENLMKEKDLSVLRHSHELKERNRGVFLRDYFAKDGDLALYGSSELGSLVKQNPINLYPFNEADYDLSIYGVAHVQNLQQASMLGGSTAYDSNSKLGLIVSLQWFQSEDGISKEEFASEFSDIQFYQFFENEKISNENKKYYAKRTNELLKSSSMYTEERVYAKLYLSDNIIVKGLRYLTIPYYKLKLNLLETRDKLAVIKVLEKQPEKPKEEAVKTIDFKEEYKKSEEEAKPLVTNNRFNAEDKYYDKYLKDIMDSLENKYDGIDLTKSKEFEDFKFYLNVANDLGVKPYIILMNVNGWYYDYTGFDKSERTKFYNKLEKIATDNGFDVLNLQNREYVKYHLIDVMHLGWKGWLDVTENMYNHFTEKRGSN